VSDITVEVDGFPPARSEALSVLAAGHAHAMRVKQLLQATQQKLAEAAFQLLDGPVGIEITVQAPEDRDPWLATHYIAGITEILQAKAHLRNQQRIRVDLPDPLLAVGLYRNDRQIREIRFRQIAATVPRYRVHVWGLED
jgi:hypothetical protein